MTKSRFAGLLDRAQSAPEPAPEPQPAPIAPDRPAPAPEASQKGPGRPRAKKSDPQYMQTAPQVRRNVYSAVQIELIKLRGEGRALDFGDLVDHLLADWLAERGIRV